MALRIAKAWRRIPARTLFRPAAAGRLADLGERQGTVNLVVACSPGVHICPCAGQLDYLRTAGHFLIHSFLS
jgi:hypothetical protein